MEKDSFKNKRLETIEHIDNSRRRLLGKATKAVWIAPTLTFLTLNSQTAMASPPTPCPDPFDPACTNENSRTNSNRKSRRKNDGG
jgi:hypothetical protein